MLTSLISLLAFGAAQTAEPAAGAETAKPSSLAILKDVSLAEPRKTGEAETWQAYLPPPRSLETEKDEPFFRFGDPDENESGDPVFGDSGLAETPSGQMKGVIRTTPDGETCVLNGSVLPC